MSARNVPSGRWMKVQGQFKRQAHPTSLILVHVGVDQCCRATDGCRATDVEPPASLPTVSTRDVPAGRWMTVQKASTQRQPD